MIRFCENEQELYEIAKIHADSVRQTYVGIFDQKHLDSINNEKYFQMWKRFSQKEDREILLFFEKYEISGIAAVKFFVDEPGCGILDRLHVKQCKQGKGIGKSLISACAGLLFNMGFHAMQINVIGGNTKAESIYQFLGARYIGSYTEHTNHMRIVHKRYIWDKLSNIADTSILPQRSYNYHQLYSALSSPFVLFGAGEYGRAFLQQFPHLLPENIFDNDSRKWGTKINGVTVLAPCCTQNIILTASHYQEMEEQMKNLNCQRISRFYPWYKYDRNSLIG